MHHPQRGCDSNSKQDMRCFVSFVRSCVSQRVRWLRQSLRSWIKWLLSSKLIKLILIAYSYLWHKVGTSQYDNITGMGELALRKFKKFFFLFFFIQAIVSAAVYLTIYVHTFRNIQYIIQYIIYVLFVCTFWNERTPAKIDWLCYEEMISFWVVLSALSGITWSNWAGTLH